MPFTKEELEYLHETVIESINVWDAHWSKGYRDSWDDENERLNNMLARVKEEIKLTEPK